MKSLDDLITNQILDEIWFSFVQSSGPGGQNVNKVATACQMRWDVRATAALELEVKERLIKLAGNRMTDLGILVIEAKRFRSQEKNRADALLRLSTLIQKALVKPRVRKATRPSLSAKAGRVADKKKHGEIKRKRRINPDELE
ncbi:MAG: aminoacyl-tRNA hydrolase [Anaerolinea sp.]|nr:aminoacyl-tRNA hydrolase [Anaerolinea sp.]